MCYCQDLTCVAFKTLFHIDCSHMPFTSLALTHSGPESCQISDLHRSDAAHRRQLHTNRLTTVSMVTAGHLEVLKCHFSKHYVIFRNY